MANEKLVLEFDPDDLRQLNELIDKIKKGVATLDPFFDAAEMYMIDSLTKNFESEGRPQKWEPLAAITIELKGSDRILQDTGALKASVNADNTEREALSLRIWSGEQHGAFHQDVDTDPMQQFGMKNKRGMPFRPFILFQPEDPAEIEKLLLNYIDSIMD